jgi:hypothetical protein
VTDEEERRALAAWRAERKAQSDQGGSALAKRLNARPQGAAPGCLQHQWVEQGDGTHLVCAECGLVAVRPPN